MDYNFKENVNMVDKCQSIKIKKEVSVSDICSTLDGSSFHSEFSYAEYNATTVFSHSYDGDDEVFLDTEEGAEERVCGRRVPRTRRVSDVIDCLGELPSPSQLSSKESTHFPFPDFNEPFPSSPNPSSSRFQSPPVTPGSDLGYYSTVGTPPSLLNFKYSWSSLNSPAMERPISDQMDGKVTGVEKNDDTDAKPTNPIDAIERYSYRVTVEGRMPVERDSDEYNMNHERRGVSVVLNHDTFTTEPPRKGSDVDVEALTKAHEALGFEVKVYNNSTVDQIKALIWELSKADYTDSDCFCLTVLTHGMDRNILHAFDGLYAAENLWHPFASDNCVTLAGKPKLFFIQACRGTKLDGGTRLVRHTSETDSSSNSYKIPSMADFLIVHSTTDGFYSWRNPEMGTWFIQAFCQVVKDRHETTDLLKMMTIVSRKVALDFESFNDLYAERHGQKQVPNIMSTLIRDLYFRPKIGT